MFTFLRTVQRTLCAGVERRRWLFVTLFFPKRRSQFTQAQAFDLSSLQLLSPTTKKACGFVDNTSGATVSCSGDPHPDVRGQIHCMVSRMTVNNELLFRRSDADRDKRKRRLLLCFLEVNKAETWRFKMI